MRILMGIIKGPNGVYYARKKVPSRLVKVVGKSWPKKTLNTKDAKRANILAKPVLIEFDKQLARAEVRACSEPTRKSLTDAEIAQIADYHYTLDVSRRRRSRAPRQTGRGVLPKRWRTNRCAMFNGGTEVRPQ